MAERVVKYNYSSWLREHAAHVAKERVAGRWVTSSPPALNKQQVERVETYRAFVIQRVKEGISISGQAMMALTKDDLEQLSAADVESEEKPDA